MRGVEALKLTFERGILSDGTASRVAHVLACAVHDGGMCHTWWKASWHVRWHASFRALWLASLHGR